MLKLLPEPKFVKETKENTFTFSSICLQTKGNEKLSLDDLLELSRLRFWNQKNVTIGTQLERAFVVEIRVSLEMIEVQDRDLFEAQGYFLKITKKKATIHYESRSGFIYAITTLKQILKLNSSGFVLPVCEIIDFPSIPVRAVANTFSWYAGYGRIGFDMQLWGYEQWVEYLNIAIDHKINQFNMVLYGYWPFEMEDYPETVFRDVPVKIWNKENSRWLTVHFSHPNIEEPFLNKLIDLAHKLEVKFFAYVGLNSYNGAYSIKHPEKRTIPPENSGFVNDFDSLCLSDQGNIEYILDSMKTIDSLGFDGFTLEESEEGFWYCECSGCMERWHKGKTPVEAKHKANMWLLSKIYQTVRRKNPDSVLGIRAFRQPPLEKDPEFLLECVDNMPDDINLFWTPGLYVPDTEFPKWIEAFGKERIWGRDTESNAITSTMGRMFRIFESNMIRYQDETNAQVIERDIEMHISSVQHSVHGINGFMFEWYGLFMHLWAHGNYGWGSLMPQEEFFKLSCKIEFGEVLGGKILFILQNILTIHESQMPLFSTPFPFQKNTITEADIPQIKEAQLNYQGLLDLIHEVQGRINKNQNLHIYKPHFAKIENSHRRNRIIYEMVLASLTYEKSKDPIEKSMILDEILEMNEEDFMLVKDMFFDVTPVAETGVKSCMYPYHEIKRIIYNIRNPQEKDNSIIYSGIEALGWLWL
jgi:hypothetical protein